MGYWWLIGVAMWVVMLAAIFFGKEAPENPEACPKCGHETGLDGKHCADEIPDFGGWRQNEPCLCQNDYHWNYESTAV